MPERRIEPPRFEIARDAVGGGWKVTLCNGKLTITGGVFDSSHGPVEAIGDDGTQLIADIRTVLQMGGFE
jgi:hypothetical protein